MSRIGDYSFSPLARYIAPASDGSSGPVAFRPGGTRFPSISFWRSRYGYADRSMQPQFAEWLAQDFQELEAYRFGLCIRVLDFIYDEPAGGSPDERESVLAELDSLVAAGEILHLRVSVMQPEYRHYRLQFFRDHTGTDVGFWHRLALVYERLAKSVKPQTSQTIWCHALLEEARGFGCPAFTPALIAALMATRATETIETATESEEASGCDASDTSEEPDHESVVEIQEALVNSVNSVIPDAKILVQPSPTSALVCLPAALNGAAPEPDEINTQKPSIKNQDLSDRCQQAHVPSAILLVLVALILFINGSRSICEAMPFHGTKSAEAGNTPCRDPPFQGARVSFLWIHNPRAFPARAPPATKNQELVVVFPLGRDSHPYHPPFHPCRSPRWLRTFFDIISPHHLHARLTARGKGPRM